MELPHLDPLGIGKIFFTRVGEEVLDLLGDRGPASFSIDGHDTPFGELPYRFDPVEITSMEESPGNV